MTSQSTFKSFCTKGGALVATGLLASSFFSSLPPAEAVNIDAFGSSVSRSVDQSAQRIKVDHSQLLKAVEEAKAAGLNIEEKPTKGLLVASEKEVQAALDSIALAEASQAKSIRQLVSDFQAEKAVAEAEYQKALDAWKTAKAEVETRNADKKAQYDKDVAEYQAKVEAYQRLIAALENNGEVNADEFLAQCRRQSIAVLIDVTYSFSAQELEQQVEAQRAFLTQMSKLPGTTVDLYIYGREGGLEHPASNPWTPALASQNFDLSTPAGLAAAHRVLDTIKDEGRNSSLDRRLFSGGTNWEAGLRDVLKGIRESGRQYTNVIFSSDGLPNSTLSDSGELENANLNSAVKEAQRYADEIRATGAKVTPVLVRTSQNSGRTLQVSLESIGSLSGVANPELGKDYFSSENISGLTEDLWKAAVADCSPANLQEPAEPSYEDFTLPEPQPKLLVPPTASYQLSELSLSKVAPAKADTSVSDGSNIDGKALTRGDLISYKLVEDTTNLVGTAYPVAVSGMKDDFDESAGEIDLSAVRIYQVPGDTDTSSPEAVSAAVKRADAQDVTDSYQLALEEVAGFSNGGSMGYTGFMKTEGKGQEQKVILPMGYKYIHVLPFTVTANLDGDILNTAWQVTNGSEHQTETVANYLKKIEPSKDVLIKVGDRNSVDGQEIALGTVFNYQLNSSTLPADRAGESKSWTIVDDYDEARDRYEGNFLVQNRYDFVDADGQVVKAGSDISRFFTQNQEQGKVTYLAQDDFLKLMSSEANRASEQGFTVFMQVERIGTGEVFNSLTEFYNQSAADGSGLTSNRVKTFTPEPAPAPEPEKTLAPAQTAPVVKGEAAKTGGVASSQGISLGLLATAGAGLLAALGAAWAFFSRKKA